MKQLLILISSMILITSCVTKKACDQRFPPQVIIKDSIVIKDTTIYVSVPIVIPGDTITLTDSIPCHVEYEKEIKNNRQSAKVTISNGKITVVCQTDSLVKVIDSLKVIVQNKEKYTSEVKIIQGPERIKYKTPSWCWWLLSIIILYLIVKFKTPLITAVKSLLKLLTVVLMASFISAGHNPFGAKPDPGAVHNGRQEALETTKFRDKVVSIMKTNHPEIKVISDRDCERLADYLTRIKTGNGSVVIEFHLDAASNQNASGATAVIADNPTKESRAFAKELVDATADILGIRNRGVIQEKDTYRKKLALMRKSGTVALLELCFITNADDMKALDNKEKHTLLAEKVAAIIAKYDHLIS